MADNSLGAKVGVPVVVPVIGEWQLYTPNLNTGVRGTNTELAAWRQVGSEIEIIYSLSQTAAGTAGSGNYIFSLPPGLTTDTSKVSIVDSNVGNVYAYNGSLEYSGYVIPAASGFSFVLFTSISAAAFASSTLVPFSGTVCRFRANFRIPITQWAGQASVAYGAGQATATKLGIVMGGTVPGRASGTTATGYIGEFVSNGTHTAVPLPGTTVNATIVSLNLPSAGEWDVCGNAELIPGTATGFAFLLAAISLTNNALDNLTGLAITGGPYNGTSFSNIQTPTRQVTTTGAQTVYLIGQASYAVAGTGAWIANSSFIRARRVG